MTASTSMLGILGKSPVLPAPFLRAAYATACRRNDRALLRALVAREDAPDDLVATFATLKDASLEGIYLARTKRAATSDRKPERRAAVLALALTKQDIPADVWDDACDALLAKPTRTLATGLARHPEHLTPDHAAAVLKVLDQQENPRWEVYEPVVNALGAEQATTLIEERQLTNLSILGLILSHELPLEVAITGLEHAVRRAHMTVTTSVSEATQANTCQAISNVIADTLRNWDTATRDVIAQRLVPVIVEMPKILAGCSRLLSRQLRHTSYHGLPKTWTPRVGDAPDEYVPLRALLARACGPSADDLAEVVSLVGARSSYEIVEIAAVILRNPKLRVRDRHEMLWALRNITVATPVLDLVNSTGLDPIAWFPRDEAARSTWTSLFPVTTLRRHGWEAFGGREEIALAIEWANDLAANYGEGRAEFLEEVARSGLSDTELLNLPWRVIEEMCQLPGTGAGRVADSVARLLTNRLSTDSEAWLVFESVCDGFAGTFGELRDSCTAIAA